MSKDVDLNEVLERLADGELLAEIASDLGVKRTTLYTRFQVTPELSDAYARARQDGLLTRGERLRSMVANAPLPSKDGGGIDPAAVQHLKLVVDTEKWTLAKLAASIFGDRVDHTSSDGSMSPPQAIEIVHVKPKSAD